MNRADQHERMRLAVAEVAKGRSCAEVGREFGLGAGYISVACQYAGVPTGGWKAIQAAQMANLYRQGMSIDDLAKQFDYNPQYVRVILRRLGIQIILKKRGRQAGYGTAGRQYAHLDWTKQDSVLAREINLSRERIRQVRKLLGKPRPLTYYKRNVPTALTWPEGDLAKLGKYTDQQTAEMIGRKVNTVRSMRAHRGIPAVRATYPHARWKPEYLALLGTMTDKQMAKLAGVTPHTAFMWRYRRGIKASHKRVARQWSQAELALLGKVSDNEIRRRTGICMTTIVRKRRELGIPPLHPSFNPKSRRKYGPEHQAGSTYSHQVAQQGVRGTLHGPPPPHQEAARHDAAGAAPEQNQAAQVPRVGEVHLPR